LDIEAISRLIIEKPFEENIFPKGFRFLSHLGIAEKDMSQIVKQFGNLKRILDAESLEFEMVLKGRAGTTKEQIVKLREQILSGKII